MFVVFVASNGMNPVIIHQMVSIALVTTNRSALKGIRRFRFFRTSLTLSVGFFQIPDFLLEFNHFYFPSDHGFVQCF